MKYTENIIVSGFYRYYLDWIGSNYSKIFSPISLGSNIRAFEHEDWESLSKLFYRCFGDKAHINQLKKYSVQFKSLLFVYHERDEIMGYCGYYLHRRNFNGQKKIMAVIYSIGTDSVHRKKGIASQLLVNTYSILKEHGVNELYAMIHVDNIASQTLFRKNGFSFEGPIPHLYGDDAGFLVRKII